MTEKQSTMNWLPLSLKIIALLLFAVVAVTVTLDIYISDNDLPSTSTQTNTVSSSNISNDLDAPLTPKEEEIYEYTQNQFDILTNNGENYVPEIQDPQVIKLASQHFRISEDKIDEIYTKMTIAEEQP
ncbi:hypothetical protein [Ectobacillus funiculus]|uniref:Uncharacterized protein n=1 Tax=Ectobacillus funiculus TaxID=137993 RepID=A0ABV5WER7_9BACI